MNAHRLQAGEISEKFEKRQRPRANCITNDSRNDQRRKKGNVNPGDPVQDIRAGVKRSVERPLQNFSADKITAQNKKEDNGFIAQMCAREEYPRQPVFTARLNLIVMGPNTEARVTRDHFERRKKSEPIEPVKSLLRKITHLSGAMSVVFQLAAKRRDFNRSLQLRNRPVIGRAELPLCPDLHPCTSSTTHAFPTTKLDARIRTT